MDSAVTRILGIDPGLETTGFAVIEKKKEGITCLDYGVFLTDRKHPTATRLAQIATDLEEIITTWQPHVLGIEKLVFVKNVTNGLLVAQARGIVLLAAEQRKIHICELAPTEIKKQVTGNGRAPKGQIQNMVKMLFDLPEIPKPDDAADALAIAFSALKAERFVSSL